MSGNGSSSLLLLSQGYNSEEERERVNVSMKAIVNKSNWPKFLRVNDTIERRRIDWNKYLLKPWKEGEIVKVVPYDEQKSSCSTPLEIFRKRYVSVIRKDEEGNWTLRYNWDWEIFDLLNNHKS